MVKFGSMFGSKKDAPDKVKAMIGKKDPAERKALAKSTDTSGEILKHLASNGDPEIRREVAHNKNASSEILEEMARDDEWKVRYEVARNHNTPSDIVEKLCGDKDWRVREGVAWNEKASGEILEKLASDRREIRYAVLMNKHVPIKLVKQIELENEREDAERKKDDTGELREMGGK